MDGRGWGSGQRWGRSKFGSCHHVADTYCQGAGQAVSTGQPEDQAPGPLPSRVPGEERELTKETEEETGVRGNQKESGVLERKWKGVSRRAWSLTCVVAAVGSGMMSTEN